MRTTASGEPRHVGLPYPGAFVLDEAGIISGSDFMRVMGADTAPDCSPGRSISSSRSRTTRDAADERFARARGSTRRLCVLPASARQREVRWRGLSRVRAAVHGIRSALDGGSAIDGVEIGAAEWPAPILRVKGLDERFWVHEGQCMYAALTFSAAGRRRPRDPRSP